MKILVLCEAFDDGVLPGGDPAAILASALKRMGHEVTVNDGNDGPFSAPDRLLYSDEACRVATAHKVSLWQKRRAVVENVDTVVVLQRPGMQAYDWRYLLECGYALGLRKRCAMVFFGYQDARVTGLGVHACGSADELFEWLAQTDGAA